MIKLIGYLLVVIHLFLGIWSVGGFTEMLWANVPWPPFTNPNFPNWLLVIHWGSVLFASVTFLYGYSKNWIHTPQFMALAYGIMAVVCVIETFGYMTSPTKYLAMACEYLAYIIILFMLYRSPYFIQYFGRQRSPLSKNG